MMESSVVDECLVGDRAIVRSNQDLFRRHERRLIIAAKGKPIRSDRDINIITEASRRAPQQNNPKPDGALKSWLEITVAVSFVAVIAIALKGIHSATKKKKNTQQTRDNFDRTSLLFFFPPPDLILRLILLADECE